MQSIMIEAFSPDSHEDALDKALAESALHITDIYDAYVTIRELSWSEETHYRAVIEVSLASGGMKPDLEGEFDELERKEGREFKIYLSQRYGEMRTMVERYLKDRVYVNLATMPDIILSRLKPEDLLEKIVISDFREAVVPKDAGMPHPAEIHAAPDDAPGDEPEPEPE